MGGRKFGGRVIYYKQPRPTAYFPRKPAARLPRKVEWVMDSSFEACGVAEGETRDLEGLRAMSWRDLANGFFGAGNRRDTVEQGKYKKVIFEKMASVGSNSFSEFCVALTLAKIANA
jgi:hypothetical protein